MDGHYRALPVIGIVLVVIAILGGLIFFGAKSGTNRAQVPIASSAVGAVAGATDQPHGSWTPEQMAEMEKDSGMMPEGSGSAAAMQAVQTRYLDYSQANLAKATASGGRVVVFFKASWCPMCKAAEADFQAHFDQLPKDVTILKTDYDTATDLKTKYGVTMQDTFVQVDSEGTMVTKWNSGGKGVSALKANIKQS